MLLPPFTPDAMKKLEPRVHATPACCSACASDPRSIEARAPRLATAATASSAGSLVVCVQLHQNSCHTSRSYLLSALKEGAPRSVRHIRKLAPPKSASACERPTGPEQRCRSHRPASSSQSPRWSRPQTAWLRDCRTCRPQSLHNRHSATFPAVSSIGSGRE